MLVIIKNILYLQTEPNQTRPIYCGNNSVEEKINIRLSQIDNSINFAKNDLMKIITLIWSLHFILISCGNSLSKVEYVLNEAGDNREEIEKVLAFYKEKQTDSLKYKAALFLVENMSGRSSYQKLPRFDVFFDSIGKYPNKSDLDYKNRMDYFKNCQDSVHKINSEHFPKLVYDSQLISSKHFINNIELAFKAWNRIPLDRRASFNDFCNYILPYKTRNEPIEENSRLKLSQQYNWALKELLDGRSLQSVVDSVKANFNYHINLKIDEFYPQPLSVSQIENTRFGICDDGSNYLVQVFRSLGIVSTIDKIPHWGNNRRGHSWLYVKYGKDEYATDVISRNDKLKEIYKNESIPKVMRETYFFKNNDTLYSNQQDVTADYIKTVNLKVKNLFNAPSNQAVLFVFDREKEWLPVCSGEIKGSTFCFMTMGCNVLYMAASVKNDKISPINYPFFIKKNGAISFYKPNTDTMISVILTRKNSLSTPRLYHKRKWITDLTGGVFEGANSPNFANPTFLYKIENLNSTQRKNIKLKTDKKFQYIRFYAQDAKKYIAKLIFYDENHQLLKGDTFIKNNVANSEYDKIFDQTNSLQFAGGLAHFEIGLKFKKPTRVCSITFQARNDNNHINIGETYELFYWDREWKSAGTQVAIDTLLKYKIPENALLWLKNKTVGKEEQAFIIDKNKRQYWLGSDNYK